MRRDHDSNGTKASVHSTCQRRCGTGSIRRRRGRPVGLFLVVALVVALFGAASPASASPVQEAEFVSRINQLRIGLGLSPLTVDPELMAVGRSWAAGMASAGRLRHNPDYPYVLTLDWEIGAENVGTGSNVEVLMAAFVNSPGHYANLVNPSITRIGVGVAAGADGRIYTSHQFARVRGDRPGPTALSVAPASGITAPAGFAPVSPAARVLDTRRDGPAAAGTIFTLDLSGVPGVDASTTAVALSITADGPAAAGYVSAWPAHLPQPATSVLNFSTGAVRAARSSWVLVPISPDRRLRVFTSASVHLIADVTAITSTTRTSGYAAIGAAPVRAFDSRSSAAFTAGEHRTLSLGAVGVPADATLVAVNVTADVDSAPGGGVGYVSAAPSSAAAPSTSTVSVAPGSPRANFALVPIGPGGTIALYSSVGAHVIVDVAGYVAPSAPGRYVAVNPTRVADSRVTRTMLTPGERRSVALPFAGLPNAPVTVVGTLTIADPIADGWAAASDAPTGAVSNVNFAAGPGATAAGVMTPIPTGNATTLVSSTAADVIVDITGVIVGG